MAYKKKKEKDEFSLENMLASIGAGLSNAAKKPNNLMYQPDPQQMPFHASQKKGRQYLGGNRSGKTTGGINEDIWWLRGQHPFRKVPEPPIIGRITTVDFKNGVNKIILPNLRQWIPPSLLRNGAWEDSWNGQSHTLYLENGSELEIMSYEQDLDKFAGVPRHFIHFDEEPPKDIFGECKARLVDYGGSWWMTMTPVEGMTWTYEEIFEPSEKGKNPLIDIVEASPYGNSHLPKEAIDELLEGLDEEEKRIRGAGEYIAIGGLVFKSFDKDRHVLKPGIPPAHWTHYISLDAGYNNPTAVYWHAVSPTGTVITYDEHYKSEMTVQQHAEIILQKESFYRGAYGIVPFLRIADPAIKQRQQITGLSIQIEYSQHGLNFATGQTKDVNAGLDKMNNYFRTDKWYVTENCPQFLREIRKYKRAQYATSKLREKNNKQESPQKKDDHAMDSCRYFFSYMPELNMKEISKATTQAQAEIATLLQAGTTYNPARPQRIDFNLAPNPNQHYIVDEYVGEW